MRDRGFDYDILKHTAHRPWPMPNGPWVMTQTWCDLLFAHWPVSASALRARIPPEFTLDLFDGSAWLGIVAFHMTNVAPRGVPALPWVSEFPELNVRTYVRVADEPGIFFFSLDAGSALAVHAARTMLNLPYFTASMSATKEDGVVHYESRRDAFRGEAEFHATYAPTGSSSIATPGSLEYFLTERYCLYNLNHHDEPYRLDIHHLPWPLRPATAEFSVNSMAAAHGIGLPDEPPRLHFVDRQDMVAWMPLSLVRRMDFALQPSMEGEG
ncbi:MAG TPA: DUF2071 domain-containing protein [Vicinamibacterales bacterium]|nr:DUF2071 domain-containing protein [Vicinamibacterales bacterium]